jgi:hypothetical protein
MAVYMSNNLETSKGKNNDELKWLELVIQHVNSLNYGTVEIIVHDSRVIQIEKTERVRLEKASNEKTPRQS